MSGRVILSGWEFWISLSNIWAWSKKSIANNKWRLYTLSNREGEKKISSKDYFVSGRIFTEAPRLLFSWKKPARTSWWEKFRIDQGASRIFCRGRPSGVNNTWKNLLLIVHLLSLGANFKQQGPKIISTCEKVHPVQLTLYVPFSN